MADQSKLLAKDIQSQLKNIEESVEKMHNLIQRFTIYNVEHVESLSGISHALEDIIKTSDAFIESSKV